MELSACVTASGPLEPVGELLRCAAVLVSTAAPEGSSSSTPSPFSRVSSMSVLLCGYHLSAYPWYSILGSTHCVWQSPCVLNELPYSSKHASSVFRRAFLVAFAEFPFFSDVDPNAGGYDKPHRPYPLLRA